jgi:hypothetical protein
MVLPWQAPVFCRQSVTERRSGSAVSAWAPMQRAGGSAEARAASCAGRPILVGRSDAPGAQRVRGSAHDNGRPIGLPLGIADWAKPLGRALTGAVANVELTGAQALVGDVGCEKVGQGERGPQQGNGVMAP